MKWRTRTALLVVLMLIATTAVVAVWRSETASAGHDDTAELQQQFDALQPGQTLILESREYQHDNVLHIDVPGVHIIGEGTRLVATNPERSAMQIRADNVTMSGLTLSTEGARDRETGLEQHKLTITAASGVVIDSVAIASSAAAGVYVGDGARDFRLVDVAVEDTLADGIHITGGSRNGTVERATVRRSGDDGIAVVSYDGEPACEQINIVSPVVEDQRWGRGLSVVGGGQVTMSDVQVRRSSGAAIYIAVEGPPFNTQSVAAVAVSGGEIDAPNQNATVDQGAILVYSGRAGRSIRDVEISDLSISNTPARASRQVGLIVEPGATMSEIQVRELNLTSVEPKPFSANVPMTGYDATGWRIGGRAVTVG